MTAQPVIVVRNAPGKLDRRLLARFMVRPLAQCVQAVGNVLRIQIPAQSVIAACNARRQLDRRRSTCLVVRPFAKRVQAVRNVLRIEALT